MLVATKLEGIARTMAFGRKEDLLRDYFVRALEQEDWSGYEDRIVVIKGCASKLVPVDAYLLATRRLQQVVRKLMYGEPCSSVPLWRRPAPTADRPESAAAPAGFVKPALPVGR